MPENLGSVHAAEARKAADAELAAEVVGDIAPLGGASVVGPIAARADRVAVDDERLVGVELPRGGGRAREIEEREAFVDLPLLDERDPLSLDSDDLDVAISELPPDALRLDAEREHGVEIPLPERDERLLDRHPAVLDRLLVLLIEQALGAGEPPLRLRLLRDLLVVVREGRGDERRTASVAGLQLIPEGTFEKAEAGDGVSAPEGGIGEKLEILRPEPRRPVRLEEQVVSLLPGTPLERLAAGCGGIEDLAHLAGL
jgi:hypothetical protein